MRTAVVVALMIIIALPAAAAEDLGNGACRQSDGQVGMWNGTFHTDEGCITADEYAQLYSAESLKDAGVVTDYQVNDDGTTTLTLTIGGQTTVPSDPLDQVVTAGPTPEPDAPSVRDIYERLEAAGLTVV